MGGRGGVKNEGSLGLELPAAEGSKCLHVQFIVSKVEVQAVQINVLNEVESIKFNTKLNDSPFPTNDARVYSWVCHYMYINANFTLSGSYSVALSASDAV